MIRDLRQRSQEVIRAELAETAFDLIISHGYETLTAEDLARGLGVSRATFFRYLGSKDDVVVTAMLGPADQFAAALPLPSSYPASRWNQLRQAFEPAVVMTEAAPDRVGAGIRLVQSLPALGGRLRRARAPQVELLSATMAERGEDMFAAQVLASAAVAVLDLCWASWAADSSASFRKALDAAFAHLDQAGEHAGQRETKQEGAR